MSNRADDVDPAILTSLQQKHHELHAMVGLVASSWAMLEFDVNKCIWMLADLNPVAGACITAQIQSMSPRLDCLLALMKLRVLNETAIGAVNKFKQDIYAIQEKRNRLIHDPFVYHSGTQEAGKIEITAKGKPVFRIASIKLDEVKQVHQGILKRQIAFADIHRAIEDSREAWPEIPQPEADPMQVQWTLGAQNQSNG